MREESNVIDSENHRFAAQNDRYQMRDWKSASTHLSWHIQPGMLWVQSYIVITWHTPIIHSRNNSHQLHYRNNTSYVENMHIFFCDIGFICLFISKKNSYKVKQKTTYGSFFFSEILRGSIVGPIYLDSQLPRSILFSHAKSLLIHGFMHTALNAGIPHLWIHA